MGIIFSGGHEKKEEHGADIFFFSTSLYFVIKSGFLLKLHLVHLIRTLSHLSLRRWTFFTLGLSNAFFLSIHDYLTPSAIILSCSSLTVVAAALLAAVSEVAAVCDPPAVVDVAVVVLKAGLDAWPEQAMNWGTQNVVK